MEEDTETPGQSVQWGWTVMANVPAGHIDETTLLAARVNPFGAAQYEVACEIELGDGRRLPITIDVETAATLGRMLIEEAAISRKNSNDEYDAQMPRYADPRDDGNADEEVPF